MRLKKGDTYPFQQRLQYDDKTPVDLTDALSVYLKVRLDGATEYKINKPCVIVDPENGIVQYSPEDDDTDTRYVQHGVRHHLPRRQDTDSTVQQHDMVAHPR